MLVYRYCSFVQQLGCYFEGARSSYIIRLFVLDTHSLSHTRIVDRAISQSGNRPSILLLRRWCLVAILPTFTYQIHPTPKSFHILLLSNHLSTMHSFSTLLLPALLFLSTATAKHGPYIPSGSGSLPHYPTGTGAPYPISTGTGTGHLPFPTGGSPLSSINPGGPIESATTCPLPTTVTTTTQVTVTVTVPAGGGSTGTVGTGTGVVGPTASGGLVRRMEMRGFGEEAMARKERKRGFWG